MKHIIGGKTYNTETAAKIAMRNETQIAELKKEVAELKSGFPLSRE